MLNNIYVLLMFPNSNIYILQCILMSNMSGFVRQKKKIGNQNVRKNGKYSDFFFIVYTIDCRYVYLGCQENIEFFFVFLYLKM